MSLRAMFEMLNRLNHTPSFSTPKLDAKVKHKETVITVLRSNQ